MEEPEMSPNPAPTPSTPTVRFYDISLFKLVFMTVITLGVFEVYWFYKNWSLIKKAENGKYWPIIRGLFAIFWVLSLFEYIEKKAKEKGYVLDHPAGKYGVAFIVLSVSANVFGRLDAINLAMDLAGFALIFVTLVPLVQLQKAATAYNRSFDQDAGYQRGFSGVEVVWLIYGLIIFFFACVGVYANYSDGYPSRPRYAPVVQEKSPVIEKDYDGKLTKLATLRLCASFSCEVVRDLKQGTRVHVIDTDAIAAWFYVSTTGDNGNTITGWMTAQALDLIEPIPNT